MSTMTASQVRRQLYRLLDHHLREAVLLGQLRVGQLDGGDQAVAQLLVEALLQDKGQGPVVMLNLMRFHDKSLDGNGSGWDAYKRYSEHTVPMIKARGGTLLWTGDAKMIALGEDDGSRWDYVALVYYPSVEAFLDMMTSPDYEAKSDPERNNGCADHRIICTQQSYSKFKIA